jgi:hypothetical protein
MSPCALLPEPPTELRPGQPLEMCCHGGGERPYVRVVVLRSLGDSTLGSERHSVEFVEGLAMSFKCLRGRVCGAIDFVTVWFQ